MSSIENFFHPTSIAVVGASKRKIGNWAMKNLLYGYKGEIYPVNPNYKEINGLTCYPSLKDIPYHIDMVIILVPAHSTPPVLEDCARKGISIVMIQSAGFAEIGATGRAIQDHCMAIAKREGIRIWGPNCMGLMDIPKKHIFSFMSPRIYKDGLVSGRISLIVQSGILSAAFITELMGRETVGIGKVCSIGNKADVDECDLLEYLLEDIETDVIAIYIESINRGMLFVDIAKRATKPIVVLKGGKSEAGANAAISHTASLSGNSRLMESILQMSGITLAEDIFQMVDLARALAMNPDVPSPCRTAIITTSGGIGILSCDLLEKYGLIVAELSEKTKEALSSIFPDWLPVMNPVDLFVPLQLHGRILTHNQAISVLLEDPNIDAILINYVTGLEDEYLDLDAVKKIADRVNKAIVFCIMGRREANKSFRRDAQACGIQVHSEITRAVECLAASAKYHGRRLLGEKVDIETSNLYDRDQEESVFFTSEARIWDEHESKCLLAQWNIPVVEEKLVPTLSEAERIVQEMGFPIALKALVPGEVHKTELGLIHLGITTQKGLKDAYEKLQKKIESKGRILMQKQVKIEYELIAGFLRDDQFGPCIMFGLGGIFSELQPDVVFALAPMKQSEALELISRIHGHKLLEGFRGLATLRKDLIAGILVNLSHLGVTNTRIEQIDINPIAVSQGFPLAVDATVVLKPIKKPINS